MVGSTDPHSDCWHLALLVYRLCLSASASRETFQYSNLLVAAGGYAATRACIPKESLEDAFNKVMSELVFCPPEMNDTFLRQEDAWRGDAAAPHATGFDGRAHNIPISMEMSVHSVAPAGGVWSTVSDLARYVLMDWRMAACPAGSG